MRVIGRFKFWLIVILLLIYIVGIVILSAITLHNLKRPFADGNIKSAFPEEQQQQHEKFQLIIPRVPIRDKNQDISGSINNAFRSSNRRTKIQWCSKLKFLPQDYSIKEYKSPIALVSFPGSGNTWLRYLLQQVTGLHTGSVYKDYGLLKNGFPAESVTNASVLVVKTHEWGPTARHMFSKAILLVRGPEKAIQAEFNRQSGGHIGFASSDRYKRTNGKYWRHFVYEKLQGWQQLNMDWLNNFSGPIHVILYEQLVDDIGRTLKSAIKFLGVNVPMKQFNCAIERSEGIYRRKKRVLSFDPFTTEMRAKIKEVQDKVYEKIYKIKLAEKKTSR